MSWRELWSNKLSSAGSRNAVMSLWSVKADIHKATGCYIIDMGEVHWFRTTALSSEYDMSVCHRWVEVPSQEMELETWRAMPRALRQKNLLKYQGGPKILFYYTGSKYFLRWSEGEPTYLYDVIMI